MSLLTIPRLPVSRKQAEFLESAAEYRLFCGGVGSGKTEAGGRLAVKLSLSHVGFGFVGANTYQQLHTATLPALFGLLELLRIPHVFNRAPPADWGSRPFRRFSDILSIRARSGVRFVHCRSLSDPDALRGLAFHWAWLDETRDTSEEAFDVVLSRRRGFGAGPYPIGVTTTPNGYNWIFKRFCGSERLPNSAVIRASSFDNPWLRKGFVDELLHAYNKRLAQQEVYGDFVSLAEGRVFYEFDRARHVVKCDYRPDLPLIHAWDFNVSPLCSVVGQFDGQIARVIGEIHVAGSARTMDACDEFMRRYPDHKAGLHVFGDASGKHRDTRQNVDDFSIIRDAYASYSGLRFLVASTNPGVLRSANTVNGMLSPAKGDPRLFVDPSCQWTITDLESVAWKPGTLDIDKTQKDLTHHADALRYWIGPAFDPHLSARPAGRAA